MKNITLTSLARHCAWLLLVAVALSSNSCLYDNLGFASGSFSLMVKVSVPIETKSTRSSVEYEGDDNNIGPEEQRRINDFYAFIFNADGTQLLYAPKMALVSGTVLDESQTYSASINIEESFSASIWVVANLEQNGIEPADIDALIGHSKADVQAALVYSYDYSSNDDGTLSGWDISEHSLPMWGEALVSGSSTISIDPDATGVLYVSSTLYRAVAKMGFTVDIPEDGDYEFNLQEVYVYYANDRGAVAPDPDNVPDSDWQYLTPDVPASSSMFTKDTPIKYETGGVSNGEEWFNQVFVAESDNSASVQQHLVLVLGGTYAPLGVTDEAEISYYRVDMENDISTVDVIRNHSYIFRILDVVNPGTSDPDPDRATDGLVVEIEDYVEEEMRGINSQYTLTVNQSAFAFASIGSDVFDFTIETDGVSWEWDRGEGGIYYNFLDEYNSTYDDNGRLVDEVRYLLYVVGTGTGTEVYLVTTETNADGVEEEVKTPMTLLAENDLTDTSDMVFYTDSNGDIYYRYLRETDTGALEPHDIYINWLVFEEGSITGTTGSYVISSWPNIGTWEFNRNAYIYITAGSIKKRILFVQPVGESANSAVITRAGTYAFNSTEAGNGGTSAETEGGDVDVNVNFGFPTTLDKDDVAEVALIWETVDGLIDVRWDEETFRKTGCVRYIVSDVQMTTPDNVTNANWSGSVFAEGNGANALIGAFDSEGNVLWSWHVWVVGDYAKGVKTELWSTGYEYMDRNLGAYSNLPGSKSFGLLYQWGRKDPFIGAYREHSERDYHQVPKQYVSMKYTNHGNQWEWGHIDDVTTGGDEEAEEAVLAACIQNPTSLLDGGLLSDQHSMTSAHGLWGAETTDVDEEEAGSKTMWDPCPEGYRVPTLNALTIYDGVNDMWTGNGGGSVAHASRSLRFVPIVADETESNNPWQTGGNSSDFVSDAPFYGFWLEYGDGSGTGNFATTYDTSYGVGYYGDTNFGYIDGYSGTKPDWATWIPLAGIYNGSLEHFGRAGITDRIGNDGAPYLPASSLHVTSVIWGNSPTQQSANHPGGLLLHGTEGAYAPHYNYDTSSGTGTTYQYSPGVANGGSTGSGQSTGTGTQDMEATEGEGYWTTATEGYSTAAYGWWTGSWENNDGAWNGVDEIASDYSTWYDENGEEGSGRHFHSYMESNTSTLANPAYAATVRCIVDKGRLNAGANSIQDESGNAVGDDPYDLYYYNAGQTLDELTFVVYSIESWTISNPGAKWTSVTPLAGNNDGTYGDYSTFSVTINESASTPSVGDTATITVKFLSGSTQSVTVQYAGETRNN